MNPGMGQRPLAAATNHRPFHHDLLVTMTC